MIIRSGVPQYKLGDFVEQDSIIIEGRVPVYNEDQTIKEYLYVNSDADIYMQHTEPVMLRLPYDYIKKSYTGREKKRYFVRFGEKELKYVSDKPFLVYDTVIKENVPELFETFHIPIFWGSYTFREYQNVEYEYTLEEAVALLNDKKNKLIVTLDEKGVQIIEESVKMDSDIDGWLLTGELQVIEKITKTMP